MLSDGFDEMSDTVLQTIMMTTVRAMMLKARPKPRPFAKDH